MCVKTKGNSGTWHWARGPQRSQLNIIFQTRPHWTTVIRPQNGNKSAHWGLCYCDLWARWPAESMDQGQETRGRVWGKEIAGKLVSRCVHLLVSICVWVKAWRVISNVLLSSFLFQSMHTHLPNISFMVLLCWCSIWLLLQTWNWVHKYIYFLDNLTRSRVTIQWA